MKSIHIQLAVLGFDFTLLLSTDKSVRKKVRKTGMEGWHCWAGKKAPKEAALKVLSRCNCQCWPEPSLDGLFAAPHSHHAFATWVFTLGSSYRSLCTFTYHNFTLFPPWNWTQIWLLKIQCHWISCVFLNGLLNNLHDKVSVLSPILFFLIPSR